MIGLLSGKTALIEERKKKRKRYIFSEKKGFQKKG